MVKEKVYHEVSKVNYESLIRDLSIVLVIFSFAVEKTMDGILFGWVVTKWFTGFMLLLIVLSFFKGIIFAFKLKKQYKEKEITQMLNPYNKKIYTKP